ncbi:MAG: hypothetical protein IPL32_17780 [Chloracidobacterium sp.]|nr:hypothetical protein [Chloracidobacterium sp.]
MRRGDELGRDTSDGGNQWGEGHCPAPGSHHGPDDGDLDDLGSVALEHVVRSGKRKAGVGDCGDSGRCTSTCDALCRYGIPCVHRESEG